MDKVPPDLACSCRRAREESEQLGRPMERARMLQADECTVSRPFCVLGFAAGCPRDVQVDIPAGRHDLFVGFELPPEEPVANEMTLPGQSLDHMNSPGIAAVQLSRALGEP